MTNLLEKAFNRASRLSPEDQDALAERLLAELESEERWTTAFESSEDILTSLADEALEEHRKGQTKPLDPDTL